MRHEKYITETAKEIVSTMRTPAAFLSFLSDVMGGLHKFIPSEQQKGAYYFIRQHIEYMALPWIKEKNSLDAVSNGVNILVNEFAGDEYLAGLNIVIQAFSYEINDVGGSEEWVKECNSAISACFKIAQAAVRNSKSLAKVEAAA